MRLPDRTGFRGKTLWDWLQLLIVPTILIAVTFAWSATQTRSDNKREDRRIAADRAAAEEARRDATLQAYLDEMSGLMLHERLLTSRPGAGVRAVARTVTLTALRRLDGERRAAVARFLFEARLLEGKTPLVLLEGADLEDAILGGADLESANLGGVDLGGAFLRTADLGDANLILAGLRGADLVGANLGSADLGGAFLDDANLAGANLRSAHLEDASLGGANLQDARLDDANLLRANLEDANLEDAILDDANLLRANLEDANLEDAYLGANLVGTNLKGANLEDAHLGSANLRGANLKDANLRKADLEDASLVGANLASTRGLDLGSFITDLRPEPRKAFLDSQKAFLDSLSREELAKFNLSPEKLARLRREAGGPKWPVTSGPSALATAKASA